MRVAARMVGYRQGSREGVCIFGMYCGQQRREICMLDLMYPKVSILLYARTRRCMRCEYVLQSIVSQQRRLPALTCPIVGKAVSEYCHFSGMSFRPCTRGACASRSKNAAKEYFYQLQSRMSLIHVACGRPRSCPRISYFHRRSVLWTVFVVIDMLRICELTAKIDSIRKVFLVLDKPTIIWTIS